MSKMRLWPCRVFAASVSVERLVTQEMTGDPRRMPWGCHKGAPCKGKQPPRYWVTAQGVHPAERELGGMGMIRQVPPLTKQLGLGLVPSPRDALCGLEAGWVLLEEAHFRAPSGPGGV